jgi:hypothetical protein
MQKQVGSVLSSFYFFCLKKNIFFLYKIKSKNSFGPAKSFNFR